MGADDDLNASIAHVVLFCVAGRGASRFGSTYHHPGMHGTYFIHGVIGALHFQSGLFNNDFGGIYQITLKASRYLPLPCLLADLYKSNTLQSTLHLLSGLIPFALAVAGKDDPKIGNAMIAINVIALAYYSFDRNRDWGWYTTAAAILTYFGSVHVGPSKIVYPLGLALVDYCGTFNNDFGALFAITYKASRYLPIPCLMADLYRRTPNRRTVHLLSGLIPFALALSGNDDAYLGNFMVAINVIALAHYSFEHNREWGWYTAAAALVTYFCPPDLVPYKIVYPLGLAVVDYCAYRVFWRHWDDLFAPPPPPPPSHPPPRR